VEPVTLAEAKRWLNLDDDIVEDDELVTALIKAARELVEKECAIVLIDGIYELKIDNFPCDGKITLPVQPLIDVIAVQYLLNVEDVNYTDLPTDQWSAVKDEPPCIQQNWWQPGLLWPSIFPRPGAVLVTFRAGYESAGSPQDASTVPETIKTAIKMLVSHWYEHREATSTDHRNTPTEIPLGMQRLLDPYRRVT
jgi:uncharacterized phiE125 gp8 family phage protein